ncbi:MAG: MBL fold metallo-hydrolase [Nitrososphaerota archaeon]
MPSRATFGGVTITWLGHDGFLIEGGGRTVVIDPFQVKARGRKADVAFVTHDHFDHCSPDDLRRFVDPEGTTVVAAANCSRALRDLRAKEVRYVRPGDSGEVAGIGYRAVHAYNVNKFRAPGQPFHPREYGGVGYVIRIGGVSVYHAGDTDFIPEMRELGQVDVALLPVSGTYVMTAEEAAEAAKAISPKLAIPMHFGAIVGSIKDAERFRSLVNVNVEVLQPEV